MNRGIITISETGVVIVPTAPIWMTKFEIADMFGGILVRHPQGDTSNLQEQGTE